MALIGYILGVPTGLALVWLLARAIVRTFWIERPHGLIYGDVVTLPEEAKAAGGVSRRGDSGFKTASAQTNRHGIARHVGSATK